MTVTRRPPRGGGELAALQREISQLFGRVCELEVHGGGVAEWVPPVDVYESRGKLIVVVEVPGLLADAVRVVWRDGRLVVTGERREERPTGAGGFLCMERPHGRFVRTIQIAMPVDLACAEARLAGGLLTITIPRLKDRRGNETVIPIQREQT
jgi:HSP20 family protein